MYLSGYFRSARGYIELQRSIRVANTPSFISLIFHLLEAGHITFISIRIMKVVITIFLIFTLGISCTSCIQINQRNAESRGSTNTKKDIALSKNVTDVPFSIKRKRRRKRSTFKKKKTRPKRSRKRTLFRPKRKPNPIKQQTHKRHKPRHNFRLHSNHKPLHHPKPREIKKPILTHAKPNHHRPKIVQQKSKRNGNNRKSWQKIAHKANKHQSTKPKQIQKRKHQANSKSGVQHRNRPKPPHRPRTRSRSSTTKPRIRRRPKTVLRHKPKQKRPPKFKKKIYIKPRPRTPHRPRPNLPHMHKPNHNHKPKPKFPHRPKPKFHKPMPYIPHKPKPKIPHRPRPHFLQQPKPNIPHKPKPKIPHRPRPHFLQQPKPSIPFKPKPKFPYRPRPHFLHKPNVQSNLKDTTNTITGKGLAAPGALSVAKKHGISVAEDAIATKKPNLSAFSQTKHRFNPSHETSSVASQNTLEVSSSGNSIFPPKNDKIIPKGLISPPRLPVKNAPSMISTEENKELPRPTPNNAHLEKPALSNAQKAPKKVLFTGIPPFFQPSAYSKRKKKICRKTITECGQRCRGQQGLHFENCEYNNLIMPKICKRKVKRKSLCNSGGKICVSSALKMSICFKKIQISTFCPGFERRCRFKKVEFGPCMNKKLERQCEKYRQTKCKYVSEEEIKPCVPSAKKCETCFEGIEMKTCSRNEVFLKEVPCSFDMKENNATFKSGSTNSSPSLFLTNLPSKSKVQLIKCYASFFDSRECKNVPSICDILDDSFDGNLCSSQICHLCSKGKLRDRKIIAYCKNVNKGICDFNSNSTKEVIPGKPVIRIASKCYRKRTVTKYFRCDRKIEEGMVCENGCLVKGCKRITRRSISPCQDNLPKICSMLAKNSCIRKQAMKHVCRKGKICSFEVDKPVLCPSQLEYKYTCGGTCHVDQEELYVCGVQRQPTYGKCKELRDPICTASSCVRTVCN